MKKEDCRRETRPSKAVGRKKERSIDCGKVSEDDWREEEGRSMRL